MNDNTETKPDCGASISNAGFGVAVLRRLTMCDVVLCGGVTCETQGELCERMGIAPDGLMVLHGLEPSLETCLCTVDIEATAAKNGYTAKPYYDQVADWILTPNVEGNRLAAHEPKRER